MFQAKWASLFIFSAMATGCSTIRYLTQASLGQFEIWQKSEPIDRVLLQKETPDLTKNLLAEVSQIKKWGEQNGLKATQNYVEYADLKRQAAVWVVSASDAAEFKPRIWGFPIVGKFTYLGWFNLESAKKFAEDLKQEGLDVDLRGAGAYSTLGWFKDPVLSTMLGQDGREDLISTILHESVHATFYIKDQSYFNESLAEFVAGKLTETYLGNQAGVYRDRIKRSEERQNKLHQAYLDLQTLYQSSLEVAQKLEQKKIILERLKKELGTQREINNATLIQYQTYGSGEKEFDQLLIRSNQDWGVFWKKIKALSRDSFAKVQDDAIGPVLNQL